MMNAKYKIVIIEPSQIVAIGLKTLIEKKNSFTVTSILSDLSSYNEFQHGTADIIVVNPSVINHCCKTDPKACMPTKGNCACIALTYGPYDEATLRQYDEYIGIFYTPEHIEKKLLAAIEKNEENPRTDNNAELSTREREILTAVAQGKTNKEIADEFNLSIHTVVSHRKNISHKLGINSISGLTIYAIINKMIEVTDF